MNEWQDKPGRRGDNPNGIGIDIELANLWCCFSPLYTEGYQNVCLVICDVKICNDLIVPIVVELFMLLIILYFVTMCNPFVSCKSFI